MPPIIRNKNVSSPVTTITTDNGTPANFNYANPTQSVGSQAPDSSWIGSFPTGGQSRVGATSSAMSPATNKPVTSPGSSWIGNVQNKPRVQPVAPMQAPTQPMNSSGFGTGVNTQADYTNQLGANLQYATQPIGAINNQSDYLQASADIAKAQTDSANAGILRDKQNTEYQTLMQMNKQTEGYTSSKVMMNNAFRDNMVQRQLQTQQMLSRVAFGDAKGTGGVQSNALNSQLQFVNAQETSTMQRLLSEHTQQSHDLAYNFDYNMTSLGHDYQQAMNDTMGRLYQQYSSYRNNPVAKTPQGIAQLSLQVDSALQAAQELTGVYAEKKTLALKNYETMMDQQYKNQTLALAQQSQNWQQQYQGAQLGIERQKMQAGAVSSINAPTTASAKYLDIPDGTDVGVQCGQFARTLCGLDATPGGNSLEARKKAYAEQTPVAGGMVLFTGGGYDSTYGHIAAIESVNPDGTINVVESNLKGDNRVSRRTIQANDPAIHGFYNDTPLATSTQGSGTQGSQYTDSDIELLAELANMDASSRNTALKAQGIPLKAVTDYMAQAKAGKIPATESQKQSATQIMANIQDIAFIDWNDATGSDLSLFHLQGTDRATAETKINNLVASVTLPNLGMLKGPMSDKDLAFIQNASSKLAMTQNDTEFEKQLVDLYNISARKAGLKEITKLGEIPTEKITPGYQPQSQQATTGGDPTEDRLNNLFK